MKKNNSLITTKAMESLKQTGMLVLETGLEDQSNLVTIEDRLKHSTVHMIPSLFKKDAKESMMLRVWEIRQAMRRSEKLAKNNIDTEAIDIIQIMANKLQPCNRKQIAVCIETIASTFSINIPNELGLEQYFRILLKYPASMLTECTDDIIKTFKYQRLPLPKEFIDRIDTNFEYHKGWLQNITKTFYDLELYVQNGNINKTNKE